MTFHVEFFANQLFLRSVKKNLEKCVRNINIDEEIEMVAISIITLIAGFESTLNLIGFYINDKQFNVDTYLNLSRAKKISKLLSLKPKEGNGNVIYSDTIIKLIDYRNNLVHYKSPYIGLFGLEDYVNTDIYIPSEMKPEDLTLGFLKDAYSEVLKLLRNIINGLPLFPEANGGFEYLYTEEYKILLVG